ncbi:hypothetical protein SAMN05444365_11465 [Micromonospora pattaloongensis]|uniref:Uncharacterized protein n=1 Tax=Micromonospora pattaloongensis TaxID=405436 RepID=A0A1H3SXA2_9ACTN|nr:hypothetical protein [Micromonospora pattaloongensis]SDZ41739.1 hypothetical protein SAMN05444365_11465 [Micromonospora pattaloongensis]
MTLYRSTLTIPPVPAGTLLELDADDWLFGRGQPPGQPYTLVVTRVRIELARCYDNELVWVIGHAPDCAGDHPPCREALVRTTALRHRAETRSGTPFGPPSGRRSRPGE